MIDELSARRALGMQLGLEAIEAVYDALGRPGTGRRAVHVVGTNGKGSTAFMLEHALRGRGWRTGLYTSPHLHRVTERVRLGGIPVSPSQLRSGLEVVRSAETPGRRPLTFFEVLTLAGLVIFEQAAVDVMIVEAGLGGARDATRIIGVDAVALTVIGLDHADAIGPTRVDIAREKAGAMRLGVPTYSAIQVPEVTAVLDAAARAVDSPLRVVPPLPVAPAGLVGDHQRHNAAVALAIGQQLDADLTTADLDGVRIPGRLERLLRGAAELWLDVAHNPEGIAAVVAAVEAGHVPAPTLVVFGCHADKDRAGMEAALGRLGCPRWWVPPEPDPHDRGSADGSVAGGLAAAGSAHGLAAAGLSAAGSATDGSAARRFDGVDDPALAPALVAAVADEARILCCGAHRVVAAVRAWARDDPTPADPQDPRPPR